MARERGERPSDANGTAPQSTLNVAVVHQLVKLMSSGDIEEITIESPEEGMKLSLRKPTPLAVAAGDLEPESADGLDGAGELSAAQPSHSEVGSPLVGVFRASMKPGGKPLVSV